MKQIFFKKILSTIFTSVTIFGCCKVCSVPPDWTASDYFKLRQSIIKGHDMNYVSAVDFGGKHSPQECEDGRRIVLDWTINDDMLLLECVNNGKEWREISEDDFKGKYLPEECKERYKIVKFSVEKDWSDEEVRSLFRCVYNMQPWEEVANGFVNRTALSLKLAFELTRPQYNAIVEKAKHDKDVVMVPRELWVVERYYT